MLELTLLFKTIDLLNCKSLGITDVGKVGDELEAINNLATSRSITLDTKAENTTEAPLQVLLSSFVVRMALKPGVRHPADIRTVFEVLGQGQGVLGMSLGTEGEGLDTEEELLGSEGVQSGTEISENLDSGADDEGDGAKGLPELEAVVTVGGFVHLREAVGVLAPVKLARVDNDTTNGGTMATNPLGGRVNDDIGTMVDGSDKVTASTKGVVDLSRT